MQRMALSSVLLSPSFHPFPLCLISHLFYFTLPSFIFFCIIAWDACYLFIYLFIQALTILSHSWLSDIQITHQICKCLPSSDLSIPRKTFSSSYPWTVRSLSTLQSNSKSREKLDYLKDYIIFLGYIFVNALVLLGKLQ